MQSKFTLPVVILSVITAIAFTVQWARHQNRVYELNIATGGDRGEYYAFAQALSNVVARHQPQIRIKVLASDGASQNLDWMEQGKAQLAIVQSNTPSKPSVRAVAYLFPEVFHLIARPDSGIQTIDDLRGKRIALMPQASGSYGLFWLLSQHYSLTGSDFTALTMQPSQAYEALRQGRVDALFRVIAIGNPATGTLLRESHARLIPIDQVDALRLSLPYVESTTIPKGTYDGAIPIPSGDLPGAAVRAVLISRADVESDVVRAITQTLFEFRNEIVEIYPRAATIRLPESGENLGLPIHPGARAYYNQDKPNFLVEYADSLGLLLSVAVLLVSGVWQFRLWLDGRQKNRADMYNLEILELIEHMQAIDDVTQLESARDQLFEILRKVVVDLDKDRISPESFQSFTFPWEVAITTLRHREMVLLNLQPRQSFLPTSPDQPGFTKP
jgi:TRAP transporter TAXI family solute receptor